MNKEHNTYLGVVFGAIKTLLIGMKTSIKVYFRKKVTEQYPENRKELKMFDRFRGTLTMPHNENNEHRCIACGLCQMACPNDTIKVISKKNTPTLKSNILAPLLIGRQENVRNDAMITKKGARLYKNWSAFLGLKISFVSIFNTSAKT